MPISNIPFVHPIPPTMIVLLFCSLAITVSSLALARGTQHKRRGQLPIITSFFLIRSKNIEGQVYDFLFWQWIMLLANACQITPNRILLKELFGEILFKKYWSYLLVAETIMATSVYFKRIKASLDSHVKRSYGNLC